MNPTGQQLRLLRDALLAAFDPPQRFDAMLLFQLDLRRTDISLAPDQQTVVLDVIRHFLARGELGLLIRAARMANPTHAALAAAADQLAPGGPRLSSPGLERTIRDNNRMLDPRVWRTRLAAIEHQVCRVELGAGSRRSFGTGFLVAPDLVLTNYHVVEPLFQQESAPDTVGLRFDYALLEDGHTRDPGTLYRLAADWLVDASPYSASDQQAEPQDPPADDELDYALLRLADEAGNEPPGGAVNRDPAAMPRGWLRLDGPTAVLEPETALFIVQHPDGGALKLALDMQAIIGTNQNGTRVRYRTNTEPGSSGSPCFDQEWNLVAVHHLGDPRYRRLSVATYNQGIPIAAITALLQRRGKLTLLAG